MSEKRQKKRVKMQNIVKLIIFAVDLVQKGNDE